MMYLNYPSLTTGSSPSSGTARPWRPARHTSFWTGQGKTYYLSNIKVIDSYFLTLSSYIDYTCTMYIAFIKYKLYLHWPYHWMEKCMSNSISILHRISKKNSVFIKMPPPPQSWLLPLTHNPEILLVFSLQRVPPPRTWKNAKLQELWLERFLI